MRYAVIALCFAGVLAIPLVPRNASSTPSKIILDNDWLSNGYIPFLLALNAGWDVLGLVGDTANTWALQTSLHALATLEIGNLSCIPVYKGADYPLLNTPKLMQAWEEIHGALPFAGAFMAENLTAEALGSDPRSGNPNRVVRAAFTEGFPNTTIAGVNAASWMVEQVRKYPGEVVIYSAGSLTNTALAVRMDPDFAKLAKQLVIMGGYIDTNLFEVTGTVTQAAINGDINLMIDPEASKIALTADFPKITIVGNGANQVYPDQAYMDQIYSVKTPYSTLMYKEYGLRYPFWDETALFAVLDPKNVLNSTSFYLDVDTAYSSPSYGNIHAYQKALMPKAQSLREVEYVNVVDAEKLKAEIMQSVQYPKSCADF